MDRARFSTIAHRDHVFANPFSEAKIDRVLGLLDLQPGSAVLDVGCGNAELLIRLIERCQIVGVGVDPNAAVLDEARRRKADRIPDGQLQLHQCRAEEDTTARVFDAALCVGSTHAYGDYQRTLTALKRVVRPGGHMLIGEGYWKRPPDASYLQLLGAEPDELTSHAENVSRAAAAGLTPLYTITSSDDEWDHYEGLYCRAVQRYVAAHPEDPEAAAFTDYIRQWYAGYIRWGRETLGFGLYLLRV